MVALHGTSNGAASPRAELAGKRGPACDCTEGTAAFLAKGAGLISQLDQSILRRVADLSF